VPVVQRGFDLAPVFYELWPVFGQVEEDYSSDGAVCVENKAA
jgi:hypothetical protein